MSQVIVKCKLCSGIACVVRYGTYNGIQRYYCKRCKHKFFDNTAPPGMRTSVEQISLALSMANEGMTSGTIRRILKTTYDNFPSVSTIYEWIIKFTQNAASIPGYVANTGDVWLAIDSALKIGGVNMRFWDVLDQRTKFLLASRVSSTRTVLDVAVILTRALRCAVKIPKIIVTHTLLPYSDGVEMAFGAYTKHRLSKNFGIQATKDIRIFRSILKKRAIILQGLRNKTITDLVVSAWLIHYNHLRPHPAMAGKTPAQVAGVVSPYNSWADIVLNFTTQTQPQPIKIK